MIPAYDMLGVNGSTVIGRWIVPIGAAVNIGFALPDTLRNQVERTAVQPAFSLPEIWGILNLYGKECPECILPTLEYMHATGSNTPKCTPGYK
jgi:hypothetical protein